MAVQVTCKSTPSLATTLTPVYSACNAVCSVLCVGSVPVCVCAVCLCVCRPTINLFYFACFVDQHSYGGSNEIMKELIARTI